MPRTRPDVPAAAYLCLRALAALSTEGAIATALRFCREPWVTEANHKGKLASEVAGVFNLIGEDEETAYPSVVVKVARTPWKIGQLPRVGYCALYLTPRNDWKVVAFDGLREERRRCSWPIDPDNSY